MSRARTAIILGGTGAVGRELLDRLLANDAWVRVVGIGRGSAPLAHPRLGWIRSELAELPTMLAGQQYDDAFCCLGATMKRAGSRAAFRAVDVDGVTVFARAARSSGAEFFGLVSAAGAAAGSRSFYLAAKGEAEAAVAGLGFPRLAIMQPGLLRGSREDFRLGERLGQFAAPLTDRLMLGPLARYRSVAIAAVAAALIAAAQRQDAGAQRYGPAEIERLAREA